MRGKMCLTSINATAARLLDRNARLWEPVLTTWKGRGVLMLGALALSLYGFAIQVVLGFACLGGSYYFDVLIPSDPTVLIPALTIPVVNACLQIVHLSFFLFVVVGILSLTLAAIIPVRRRQERTA